MLRCSKTFEDLLSHIKKRKSSTRTKKEQPSRLGVISPRCGRNIHESRLTKLRQEKLQRISCHPNHAAVTGGKAWNGNYFVVKSPKMMALFGCNGRILWFSGKMFRPLRSETLDDSWWLQQYHCGFKVWRNLRSIMFHHLATDSQLIKTWQDSTPKKWEGSGR